MQVVVVRACLSLTSLVALSVAMRLYAGSVAGEDAILCEIMRECEHARQLADRMLDRPTARSKHLGVCLGLCTAARALATDTKIEEATAIHVSSYLERINAALQAAHQSASGAPANARPKA